MNSRQKNTLLSILVIFVAIMSQAYVLKATRVLSEDFAGENHLATYPSAYEKARYTMGCWLERLASGPSPKGPDPTFLEMINYRHYRVIVSSSSGSELKSIEIEAEGLAMANLKSPWKKPIRFVGSCDGLLCALHDERYLFLWNPCTGQYKRLPYCPFYRSDCYYTFYGLGYDKSIDGYKVVKGEFGLDFKVFLYTRKTNSRKSIEDRFHYKFSYISTTGIFVDGFLHWVANNYSNHIILSLDLAKEKFGEMAIPNPNCRDVKNDAHRVGVLKGMLCLYCLESSDSPIWTIWVMKEYGVTDSWTVLMKIPSSFQALLQTFFMPLCLTKNGEVVMQVNNGEVAQVKIGEVLMRVRGNNMFKYNPKENTFKKLLDIKPTAESATYVENLVSPNIDN
ncbi:hypothetical protein F0562_006197 [Nyssa sinensis]|uniref:F-box associated beta-propeller type 1 domain-containing protein n=1 Tax=Nyssa sinensis TaxID=561372 RepID=A0A5J5AL58_9ASTE|nr:hypothetical protein F0562_006197 [Nyssa sinensis]